ncbi:hypothetical protein CPB86DRAFT_57594 [Serendipita vermifera]|nr:hypothetical protein CPB86DRAFT_57594 [Serendipita vermifera]
MADLFNLPIPHPRHRPSTSEIQTSPSVISALERSIKDIQNQANQLQLQLEALQQRKANCLSYVAPLRRLPPEILSNIITFCLEKGIEITTLTQSCGVIRDAVLDMPTIWRNIHLLSGFDPHLRMLTYGRNKKLGIRCFTQEQLETVLTRSKSTPLRLNLEWPVDERSLELISSRNRLIESLNVNAFETKIIRSERNFSILNFASLKHLHLTSLDSMIVENLLNAILQSISDGMALTLVDYSLTTIKQFLEHHINQRITNLCIVAGIFSPPHGIN